MKAMKSRAYLEKLIAEDPERCDLPDASGSSNQLSQSPVSLMLATGPKAVNRPPFEPTRWRCVAMPVADIKIASGGPPGLADRHDPALSSSWIHTEVSSPKKRKSAHSHGRLSGRTCCWGD